MKITLTPQPIGPQLKNYRERQGLSLKDIALKTGSTPSNICHLESRTPNVGNLLEYCKALGATEIVIKLSNL